jgi:hypothetical protein
MNDDDRPRSMRDASVRERRKAMLTLSHVAPLKIYAGNLRDSGLGQVPDFRCRRTHTPPDWQNVAGKSVCQREPRS